MMELPEYFKIYLSAFTLESSDPTTKKLAFKCCAGLILSPLRTRVTDSNFEAKCLLNFNHKKSKKSE